MEEQIVRESLVVTTRQVTEADKAIAREYNAVVMRAIAQANRYLTFGPESARQAVTLTLLRSAAKQATVDAKAEIDVSRQAFLEAFSQMTVTHNGELAAPTVDIPTVDQDDSVGDTEVRSRLLRS